MKVHFLWYIVLSGISGSMLPLAFSPLEILPVLYVSLALWVGFILMALQQRNIKKETPVAFWPFFSLGFSFGLGWFLVGVNGLYVTFSEFGGLSPALSILCVLLFSAYLALFPACVSICFAKAVHRYALYTTPFYGLRPLWIVPCLFASILTLFEWLRGELFTGFPAISPGYAQMTDGRWEALSVKAWAAYIGWLGLSWWSAFLSALLVMMLWQVYGYWRTLLENKAGQSIPFSIKKACIGVFIIVGIVGFSRVPHVFFVAWTQPLNTPQAYRLVQGNIPILKKWNPQRYQNNLNILQELIDDAADEIVILSETALTLFHEPLTQTFLQQMEYEDRYVIAGGIEVDRHHDRQDYYNSLLILDGMARLRGKEASRRYYRKHHLVPFGEYPPPGFLWIVQRLSIPMADLSAGENTEEPLPVRTQQVAFSICYENLFIQEIRHRTAKANLLINISNTGWYGESWAMPQHLQVSRMRAREAQKPMLHVADTGISAFIDTQGSIRQSLPIFQRGILKAVVDGYEGVTPYLYYGDYPLLGLSLWSILMLLFYRKE